MYQYEVYIKVDNLMLTEVNRGGGKRSAILSFGTYIPFQTTFCTLTVQRAVFFDAYKIYELAIT